MRNASSHHTIGSLHDLHCRDIPYSQLFTKKTKACCDVDSIDLSNRDSYTTSLIIKQDFYCKGLDYTDKAECFSCMSSLQAEMMCLIKSLNTLQLTRGKSRALPKLIVSVHKVLVYEYFQKMSIPSKYFDI